MAATLTQTESEIVKALRLYMLTLFGSTFVIVKGQVNRVPEPKDPNFIVITPILRKRISTNSIIYHDVYPALPASQGTKDSSAAMEITIQVDVHGPLSGDNAQILSTMMRDQDVSMYFRRTYPQYSVLYSTEPKEMPYLNAEQQIEFRWTMDVHTFARPTVTTFQDFADKLTPVIDSVQADFPS